MWHGVADYAVKAQPLLVCSTICRSAVIVCTWRGGCVRLFPARQPYEINRGPQMLARQVDSFDDPPVYCCIMRYVAVEYNNRERVSLSLIAYLCAHAANTPPLSLTIDLVPHKSSSWLARPLDAATSLARSSRATKRASAASEVDSRASAHY